MARNFMALTPQEAIVEREWLDALHNLGWTDQVDILLDIREGVRDHIHLLGTNGWDRYCREFLQDYVDAYGNVAPELFDYCIATWVKRDLYHAMGLQLY
jgi:hypothetical protein